MYITYVYIYVYIYICIYIYVYNVRPICIQADPGPHARVRLDSHQGSLDSSTKLLAMKNILSGSFRMILRAEQNGHLQLPVNQKNCPMDPMVLSTKGWQT